MYMNNESPQLEDGYTKIANELQDAFCRFRIPGSVRQVVDAIIRKTYGWQKKEDWISHSQIVKITGMKKGNVSKWLSKAITHKIVIQSDKKLKLNKNYRDWINFSGEHFNPKPKGSKLSKAITKKEVIPSDNKVIVKDSKVIVTEGNKRNYTKESINIMEEPINLKNFNEKKEELVKKLSVGISTKHQAQAFDYFKRLNINTKKITDRSLIGRWIKLFKVGNQSKIQNTLSYLVDQPKFLEKSPDEKIKLFFWCYNNK